MVDLWVPIAQCDGESAISHSWFCPIVIHYIGITTLTQDRRQLQIQIQKDKNKYPNCSDIIDPPFRVASWSYTVLVLLSRCTQIHKYKHKKTNIYANTQKTSSNTVKQQPSIHYTLVLDSHQYTKNTALGR